MRKITFSKIFALILSLLVIMGSLPVMSVSAGTTSDGLVYTVSGGEVTITSYNGGYQKIEIPAEIEGYPVTSISTKAFMNSEVNSVTIPGSVNTIGDYAFYECTGLTSVTISEGVTSIGNWAFHGCHALSSVTIPDSVNTIGNYAFSYCHGITSVTISSGVTSIGEKAFLDCAILAEINVDAANKHYTSIDGVLFDKDVEDLIVCPEGKASTTPYTVPSGVRYISNYAFSGNTKLTSVVIPDSVQSIGQFAFEYCTVLKEISIGNSVKFIGANAFRGCTSLTSVTIPNGVATIDDYTFESCTSLTSVIIPESVKSIGYNVFLACTSLASLTLPSSINKISKAALSEIDTIVYCGFPDQWESIGYTLSSSQKLLFEGMAIEVTKLPEKIEYLQADIFDPTGMVVVCKNINGETKEISDYTYDSDVGIDLGKKQIEISYYGATTTIDIVVKEKPIASISISQMPYKVVYMQGEPFESDGIELTIEYTDGTTYKTSNCTIAGTKTTEEGTKTATVVYNGKYTTFDFIVLARDIDSIEITKAPEKLEYNLSEKLDTTGMIVTVYYENGDVGTTTDYEINYNTDVAGKTDVTVTFMGKSAAFSIDVIDPEATEPDVSEPTTPDATDTTEPDVSEPTTPDATDTTDPSETKPESEYLLGDANLDGKVNVKDATLIQKYAASLETLDDTQFVTSDVDMDTKVNVKDATAIQKFSASIETGYPIGKPV